MRCGCDGIDVEDLAATDGLSATVIAQDIAVTDDEGQREREMQTGQTLVTGAQRAASE